LAALPLQKSANLYQAIRCSIALFLPSVSFMARREADPIRRIS
jgi:hypothetical protein